MLLLLSSCSKPQDDNAVVIVDVPFEVDFTQFNAYRYQATRIELPFISSKVNNIVLHGERVFLFPDNDLENQSSIVVMILNIDGSDVKNVEIRLPVKIQTAFFSVSGSGNILLFAVGQGDDGTAFFAEYDIEGRVLQQKEFNESISDVMRNIFITQVLFYNNEYIIILAQNHHNGVLYLLNFEDNALIDLQLSSGLHMNRSVTLPDGRIAVLDFDREHTSMIKELDLENKEWGEIFPIEQRNDYSLFPVHIDSFYDFLLSDSIYLYGYCTTTKEQQAILNWVETGLSGVFYFGSLDDERLYVFNGDYNSRSGERGINLYILHPVSRDDLDDRTVLTIGGVFIPSDIRIAVADFNRTNDSYKIDIVEYINANAGWEQWQGGFQRLQIELMTGSGPDIVYDQFGWMRNHEIMLDLYPFIDSDREINRSDFFPNIMASLESSNGKIPMITNNFIMHTMVGISEVSGYVGQWTPSTLLSLILKENENEHRVLGKQLTSTVFLNFMLSCGGSDLIDWENKEANLDSDTFINLLKTSTLLNVPQFGDAFDDPFDLMARGEQLIYFDNNFTPFGIVMVTGNLVWTLDDTVILGIPTNDGGANILEPRWLMGINAASNHADGAWEFIRGFLLPTVPVFDEWGYSYFQLRIDLYEEIIDFYKTLALEGDNVIYAINDSGADFMRSVAENAVSRRHTIVPELWDIIETDLESFFNDLRPAEDTARIINDRVQTFLNEIR